ncbi:MAG TPA: class I SAM-dependent methyltransferase, partial [Solirubrobacteraceae bacterium]|nr:class I SAM-dependent methyltransferase [Solirubrobacteraceae bacterium]
MLAAADTARDFVPLVNLARMLVTGANPAAHDRRLGRELERGAHDFVLDVGCGQALVLRYARPRRYVGLDLHRPSLDRARRKRGRPGVELVEADITRTDLGAWRGADVAIVSNVLHHLTDDEAVALLDRIATAVQPERILVQDAEPAGALAPVVRALDGGAHLRGRAQLAAMLRARFAVREVAEWRNPLRSFTYFLLELRRPPAA